MKKKIMIVFGTRPEAIKMAPLIHVLKKDSNFFDLKICITSQHREMLDQVLKIFKIKPDIDLNLMKNNQNLSDLSGSILRKMQKIFTENNTDILLVHGDTTTSFAAAVSGFYASIPVGHVESGLRTHNLKAPFPEEFNRQVTSKIAQWHFAPTTLSQNNLIKEGINKSSIYLTGNTVIDALFWTLKDIDKNTERKKNIKNYLNKILPNNFLFKKFILITMHRRENFGNGFFQIFSAIKKLSFKYPNIHFVYPLHLNPNVRKPAYEIFKGIKNIHIINPLEYDVFVYLMKYSYLILTDSGGVQEEAPSLGKPVLVMRDVTERPEAVLSGTVKLVGSDQKKIIQNVSFLLDNKKNYQEMSLANNPYGDGTASEQIANILRSL